MNYDPNLISSMRAVQTVRLTLAAWEYRATLEVTVGGNCSGLDVLEAAVDNAYQRMWDAFEENGTPVELVLKRPGAVEGEEDELLCTPGEDVDAVWLASYVIAVEIVSIEKKAEDV